jgi:hypothetical protein
VGAVEGEQLVSPVSARVIFQPPSPCAPWICISREPSVTVTSRWRSS